MSVPTKRRKSTLSAYALGIGLGLGAALLQWLMYPLVGNRMPFAFFLPALAIAAASFGRTIAFVVLLIGGVNAVVLAPPLGSLAVSDPRDIAGLLIYGVLGVLLVLYGGHLRITTRRAALAEKRLALAQDETGVGVFELDFQAGTAYVSPGMSQMLGQPTTSEPIDLDRWLRALHPQHVADARRAMQERLSRGEMRYEREQRIELPNGKIVWILNRVQLEASADGVLTHARGASVDITARKQADDELRAAQGELHQQVEDLRRLHAFTQGLVAAGGSLPTTLQSLLHLFIDLYGVRHGVVSLCDAPDSLTGVVAHVGFPDSQLESIYPKAAREGRDANRQDYAALVEVHRALSENGGFCALRTMPLVSAGGEVMGAISVMFDESDSPSERQVRLCEVCATTAAAVVEGTRARATAANTEQRFSVALESSIVPFSILAPVRDGGSIVDFQWSYLNPAAARALGREPAALLGERIGVSLPLAWEPQGQFDRYVRVIETGEPAQFEVCTQASNQGIRWYSVVASELQGSLAVWFADMTDRKLNEEALQSAAKAKDEFLAMLAHELRNPLGAIRQGAAIARATQSADAQRRWGHAVIDRQVTHMSRLLDDLLDVSRVGRGTLLLRSSKQVLSDIVETAIESARAHIEAKRHRLEVNLPDGPVALEVDPVRITQVIGNLLVNAAKYTDPGGLIRLSVDLDATGVAIRVRDTGIGLAPAQIEQIFSMFAQIPSAMDKSQGGLGIGLALARGLVELHGGTLTVNSAGLGQGAEFIARLPGSCLHCGDSATPQPTAAAAAKGTRSLRILIADDNRDAADSLAELLRLDGHEVHVAYDGEAALRTFTETGPDTALLDMDMPRLSGLEVARAIRQRPIGSQTTLIAVTGRGQEEDRQMALRAGFDHHITKPMEPGQIHALVGFQRAPR